MLRIAPFRQLLHPVMKPSLTTLRYAHAPTNTPQNTPSNGDALGSRITEKQTSAISPQTYGDPTPKESKTGTFNRGESSQYSSEMTKSGTHQEIVESTPEAAFDPKVTSPDQVKQTAGREPQSGNSGNPLEYSGATPEVSQVTRDQRPAQGNKDRSQASGGTKKA